MFDINKNSTGYNSQFNRGCSSEPQVLNIIFRNKKKILFLILVALGYWKINWILSVGKKAIALGISFFNNYSTLFTISEAALIHSGFIFFATVAMGSFINQLFQYFWLKYNIKKKTAFNADNRTKIKLLKCVSHIIASVIAFYYVKTNATLELRNFIIATNMCFSFVSYFFVDSEKDFVYLIFSKTKSDAGEINIHNTFIKIPKVNNFNKQSRNNNSTFNQQGTLYNSNQFQTQQTQ